MTARSAERTRMLMTAVLALGRSGDRDAARGMNTSWSGFYRTRLYEHCPHNQACLTQRLDDAEAAVNNRNARSKNERSWATRSIGGERGHALHPCVTGAPNAKRPRGARPPCP